MRADEYLMAQSLFDMLLRKKYQTEEEENEEKEVAQRGVVQTHCREI